MPIMTVWTTRKGKPVKGYRFGRSGHIYTGPGARAKALLQERAVRASGWSGD